MLLHRYGLGGGASSGTLNNCTLSGNSASNGGGAASLMLNNCTLRSNSATYGGGAHGSTLNNCTLSGNSARTGGGAYYATLNNCTLNGNSASVFGGGTYEGMLHNCTLTGNSATGQLSSGGGAYFGTLNNCIVYYNTGRGFEDNYYVSTLNYCCTTRLPIFGTGNITNAPLFVNQAGGNLRLQSNSPCINAGRNSDAPGALDLDGHPRISGGTVDMGAYEFQNPASALSYAWLQRFGLPADGSADFADPDGDQFTNVQEWRAGTDPTDSLSALRLLIPSFDGTNWLVRWQSVSNRTYTVERSVDLSVSNRFLSVATAVPGRSGATSVIVTNSTARGPTTYRVRVEK